MHIRHDPENNIAYIRFMPKGAEVETIVLSSEVNIDLAPDGSLYGIELLNANEQLKGDIAAIVFENTQTHQMQELPL